MNDVVDEKFVEGDYREVPHEADAVVESETIKQQAEKDIKELWPEDTKPPESSQDEQGGQVKAEVVAEHSEEPTQPSSVNIPTNIQELCQWVSSHGKKYTPSWICIEMSAKHLGEVDVPKTYQTLKELYNW